MDEYIRKKAIRDALYDADAITMEGVKILNQFPTEDVAPVRHGRWNHLGGDEWCCTHCGYVISTEGSWDIPKKKYCEECGARMDLEG